MIRLPIKYLRVLLMAVTSMRRGKAVAANMYRHVQIGSAGDVSLHDDLKKLESMFQGMVLEANNDKRKTFTISLDSQLVLPGLHGKRFDGLSDAEGGDITERDA